MLRRFNLSNIKTLTMTRMVLNLFHSNKFIHSSRLTFKSSISGKNNVYNFSSSYSNKPPMS